jgi:FAD synthetase
MMSEGETTWWEQQRIIFIRYVPTRVMHVVVAGTFDVLHPGHLYLFEEAAKLGELYVIVARDCNIQSKKMIFTEEERLRIVQGLKPVKKAILGDKKDFFKPVEEINPDVIFLGPDQDEEWVRSQIKERSLHIDVKKLPERLPYSSSEIKNRLCG